MLEKSTTTLQKGKGKNSATSAYNISGAKSSTRLKISQAVFETQSDKSTLTMNPADYIVLYKLTTEKNNRSFTIGEALIATNFSAADRYNGYRVTPSAGLIPGEYAFIDKSTTTADDIVKDTIQNSGLVTHGRCNQMWLEGRKYTNEPGCGCSSLGKYKVGYSYNGTFGLAYKLYGLDKTNNNAFKRFVVLHSHECVPGNEVQDDICQSDGCPTVSPQFLQQLEPVINQSGKPILLWIFE